MMRKYVTQWCVVLFLVALSAPGQDRPRQRLALPEKPDFAQLDQARVRRVVDGDTVILVLDGRDVRCRLIGVDTPETVHPHKPVEAYGRAASRFTTNLLKGERVWVELDETTGRQDRYGRLLAYLWRMPDGLMVNAEIVRQGYGHAYTRFPFERLELFRAYERRARRIGKGLWAEDVETSHTTQSRRQG